MVIIRSKEHWNRASELESRGMVEEALVEIRAYLREEIEDQAEWVEVEDAMERGLSPW